MSVSENKGNGSFVLDVTAEDADEGENATVRYSIMGGQSHSLCHVWISHNLLTPFFVTDQTYFTIDPNSGRMRSKISFGREQGTSYDMVVSAVDLGNPPLSSSVTVSVKVVSEDDSKQLIASSLKLTTMENIPIGTEIGRAESPDFNHGK